MIVKVGILATLVGAANKLTAIVSTQTPKPQKYAFIFFWIRFKSVWTERGQTGHTIRPQSTGAPNWKVLKTQDSPAVSRTLSPSLSLPSLRTHKMPFVVRQSVARRIGTGPALKAPFTHPLTRGCFCNPIFSHAGGPVVTVTPYTRGSQRRGRDGTIENESDEWKKKKKVTLRFSVERTWC